QQTLVEAYEHSLEEETLLQEIENRHLCPTCNERVQDDFQVCPSCLTKLRRQCHFCNHLLAPEWSLCPYCGRLTCGETRIPAGSYGVDSPVSPRRLTVLAALALVIVPLSYGAAAFAPPPPVRGPPPYPLPANQLCP